MVSRNFQLEAKKLTTPAACGCYVLLVIRSIKHTLVSMLFKYGLCLSCVYECLSVFVFEFLLCIAFFIEVLC